MNTVTGISAARQVREDAEAVEPRHLNVQEQEMRAFPANGGQRLDPVPALAGNLHAGMGLAAAYGSAPAQRLVVNDECSGMGPPAWRRKTTRVPLS
jgi:hypothetical protein